MDLDSDIEPPGSGFCASKQLIASSHQPMSVDHHPEYINETITDNVKSSRPKRICLVGSVAENPEVVMAAKKFNVPIETSETGKELIADKSWTTFFIMPTFDGQIFDDISRSDHKVLGSPALISASSTSDSLPTHNRPIYSYSMRGIVAAFSGIRKRDELTQLVHLIHFMGGSIRKDLNHRATHLICSNAYGEKYRYALTFRLNVVRSSWVLDAWQNRDNAEFSAKEETFTTGHRVKIFEGCRVAFIGFPENEKANMVDLLRSYNGIETASDDDTCTHKIIADCPIFPNEMNNATFDNSNMFNEEDFEDNEGDESCDQNDFACKVIQRKHESFLRHFNEQCEGDMKDLPVVLEEDESSKSTEISNQTRPTLVCSDRDGAILNDEDLFSNPNELSPILKSKTPDDRHNYFPLDSTHNDVYRDNIKRKRIEDDSIDNISMMSVESTKKSKLTRTGSLTKNLRRRMSFGIVQPINNLFKSRRNSADPNSSACSQFETTFNESIKEPIKEKLRQIKDKVSKFNKKDLTTPKSTKAKDKAKMRMASSNLSNLKDVCTIKTTFVEEKVKTPERFLQDAAGFKTPKAPQSTKSVKASNDVLVVDESLVRFDQGSENPKYHVVKAEWFWTRIAEGYAPEDDFLFKDYMQSVKDEQAEQCERRDSLINYSAKAQRKRKRLSRIVLETPASAGKRRSSISDAGILSSESLIDYTASPDKNESSKLGEDVVVNFPSKKFSMRHNHFMDFYHTESNYVGILETIVKLFKTPLEKIAEENQDHGDLLNKSEVKAIFSNFLPIYLVHKKMLNSLQEINGSWKEESSIGQIILDNRDSLLKAYPPYVNFFEQMKTCLTQCAQSKPRFQAFLKINQAKPECGRQSLQELMIRPVQRLPSISLLLNDILKHTNKNNEDYGLLVEALKTIKEVMTYINEDKRKTEGQTQMFNIFNDIENCPPHLISSHRSFVSRCEVTELSETLSGRGDTLVLFLFTDTLEICKKRSKYNNSKSPNSVHSSRPHASTVKKFKHVKLIPLSSIRTLADIKDSSRAFTLCLRNNTSIQDMSRDKLYSFSIADEDVDKTIYIKNFCKQLAENSCRTDAEKFVVAVDSGEIGIDINDVNLGTLSKAFKFATRTRMKVGRAFSFSKHSTPSRKRNVASPFGSNASLTPSTISSMSHLKLQSSCMTLNEFDVDRKDDKKKLENGFLPLTDQMSRRNQKPAAANDV